ncbi:MAG: hypothetical protein OHK0039_26420 [Bacteroidia bacterium]
MRLLAGILMICLFTPALAQKRFERQYFKNEQMKFSLDVKIEYAQNRVGWQDKSQAGTILLCLRDVASHNLRLSFGQLEWTSEPDVKNQIRVEAAHLTLGPGLARNGESASRITLKTGDNSREGSILLDITGSGKGRIVLAPLILVRGYNANPEQRMSAETGFVFNYEIRIDGEEWQKALSLANQARTLTEMQRARAALMQYRECFPDGVHYNDASAQLTNLGIQIEMQEEDEAWAKARRVNSILAYEGYKQAHPGGSYIDSANYWIEKLRAAVVVQPVEPLPSGPDKEKERWLAIRAIGTDSAYKAYLADNPHPRFLDSALLMLDMTFRLRREDMRFVHTFNYAKLPLELLHIAVEGETPSSEWAVDDSSVAGVRSIDWRDGLLRISIGPDSVVLVEAREKRNYMLLLRDALGRSFDLTVEAGLEPLELKLLRITSDSIAFEIVGGRPPYYLRFFQQDAVGPPFEVKLGEQTRYAFPKADFETQLRGDYQIMFTDERRLEFLERDESIHFGQWEFPLWLFLLILLVPLVGWQVYHFRFSPAPLH